MPRLSVTMPAFNAEATIKRAVTTTLRAMPVDSELLVLDDKSTDGTLGVLGDISDRRLRIIALENNVGKGNARMRLLAASDSEFVASMDADDISLPWRFSLQFRALRIADVLFGSAIRFGSAEPGGSHPSTMRPFLIRPSAPISLQPDEFPAALLFHNPAWQPSLLARRAAIDRVGGYKPSRFGEDWDLWLRIAESRAPMYRLATPVIAYRESPKQESRLPGQPEAIRRNTALRESYVKLFNSRVRSGSLTIGPQPAAAIKQIITNGLTEQLRAFRPLNRLHYTSFLRFDRTRAMRLFPE